MTIQANTADLDGRRLTIGPASRNREQEGAASMKNDSRPDIPCSPAAHRNNQHLHSAARG